MTEKERTELFKQLMAEAEKQTGITIVPSVEVQDLGGGIVIKPSLNIVPISGWVEQKPND